MLQIFSVGTQIDSEGIKRTFSEADVAHIAESYDPSLHLAPILVNHDESKPNKGVIRGVWKSGTRLFGLPNGITAEFREEAKGYAGLSAAFYPPQDPRNPAPGGWYLRHVALVNIPAVKGMQRPQFEEGDVLVAFNEPLHWLDDELAIDKDSIKEEQMSKPISIEDREAALAAKELQYAEREKAIKGLEDAVREAQFAEFVSSSEINKRIPIGNKPLVMATLRNLVGVTGKVEFGEGQEKKDLTPIEAYKKSLLSMPLLVEFDEVASSANDFDDRDRDPSKEAAIVAKKANAYFFSENKNGNPITFIEAVKHIQGERK